MTLHMCPSQECTRNNHNIQESHSKAQTGWICPKCNRSNAPTNIFCAGCSGCITQEDRTRYCPCRRENGGSGICGCVLYDMQIK